MKLQSSISRLEGAGHNVQNGISYLEVQDGILASAGRIVDRMIELKGMSQDMMKNDFDNATYENEFKDLQIQLYDMTQQTFNGVSLFAEFASASRMATQLISMGIAVSQPMDPISRITRFRCLLVQTGTRVRKSVLLKLFLLSALTIDSQKSQSSIFQLRTRAQIHNVYLLCGH